MITPKTDAIVMPTISPMSTGEEEEVDPEPPVPPLDITVEPAVLAGTVTVEGEFAAIEPAVVAAAPATVSPNVDPAAIFPCPREFVV
jgi:hypothetical protein